MVYNFATAIQVTLQLSVTIRLVAQGRTLIGAARTACGVVPFMILPMLTITTWVVVVGVRVATVARTPSRCAVSRNYKTILKFKLYIEN